MELSNEVKNFYQSSWTLARREQYARFFANHGDTWMLTGIRRLFIFLESHHLTLELQQGAQPTTGGVCSKKVYITPTHSE